MGWDATHISNTDGCITLGLPLSKYKMPCYVPFSAFTLFVVLSLKENETGKMMGKCLIVSIRELKGLLNIKPKHCHR